METNGFFLRPLEDGSRTRPRAPAHSRIMPALRGIADRLNLVRVAGIGIGCLLLYFGFLWVTLPDINDPASLLASQSTVITDRNGVELYRLFREEDRTFIPGSDIPDNLKKAIVAIEDERFYEHGCIDTRAVLRAILANIFGGFKSQGASTLTQQLARNALLTREKRVSRKIKEILLACSLERKYSKDELLNLYLNWIPFGQNAYGIEQASHEYFAVTAKDLTLGKSAILASLPQRPSYFSPYGSHLYTQMSPEAEERIRQGHITKASQIPEEEITIGLLGRVVGSGATALYVGGRTDQVLKNMQDLGFITEQERLAALEEVDSIVFQPSREDIRAPHFVLWTRQQVKELFGEALGEDILEKGGLRIETTLDWEVQQLAEEAVAAHAEDIEQRFGAHNIALVGMDRRSREILAYVGNRDFGDDTPSGKVDMARGPRQPGSSFKPFVYAAAFQKGYGPATVLYDVPTKIGDDEPQNFDGKFWGPLTVRQALAGSRNLPASKAFFLAGGEEPILSLVKALGAPSPLTRKRELILEGQTDFEYGWPLALGAAETPLLEMVTAYGTIADGGRFHPPVSIRRITDKNSNILFQTEETPAEEVLDPRIAYEITSILSDTAARPNEYWQQQLSIPGFEAAAKTGTSNKCLEREEDGSCRLRKPDNTWTIGYTPELVAGVWVGNADSTALYEKADGLTTAGPVWKEFLAGAMRLRENPQTTFDVPDGLARPQISLLSGQLPTECTPIERRRAELFLKENTPSLADPACAKLYIDKVTGLLASDSCPEEAREEKSFLVAESILADRWPKWEEGVQQWVKEQMALWNARPDHSGSLLPLPVAPTEKCDLALTPGRLQKPTLSIVFPEQNGSASYPAFQPRVKMNIGSTVNELAFIVDGKTVSQITEPPFEPTLRIPRSVKKEGFHTLEVKLTDQYFNTARASVTFKFEDDRNPPKITLTLPRDDITLGKSAVLTLRADASDSEGELKYVQFFLNDQLLSTKPTPPFELTFALEQQPGTYRLRAKATDGAGNAAEDEVTLTINP